MPSRATEGAPETLTHPFLKPVLRERLEGKPFPPLVKGPAGHCSRRDAHARGARGQRFTGQKATWEGGGSKCEFPGEIPYKRNTHRTGAASETQAPQKFGDLGSYENLE